MPRAVVGLDNIRLATGCEVRPAVSPAEDIDGPIGQLSQLSESVHEIEEDEEAEEEASNAIELRASANEGPVVKLVHSVIADAVERGTSDIHFEPRNGRAAPGAAAL